MKRENFMLAVEKYQTTIIRSLRRRNMTEELVQDAFQNAIVAVLNTRAYTRFDHEAIDSRMRAYLTTATLSQVAMMLRRQATENKATVSIVDLTEQERLEKVDMREREKLEQECPFCHIGFLNEYKACVECGTIIGQGRSIQERINMDEADLFSLPDLDLKIDVENALKELAPLERLVIETIANERDTLDGLADTTGHGRQNLWRVYVRAKRKLQEALLEYA